MKKIVFSVCAIVAMSGLVYANGEVEVVPVASEANGSSFYAGLGLSALSARDADASLSFFDVEAGADRLGGISLVAGYNYNENIAVEARYTTSISNEDLVEMSGWSLFVKPQYPVSEAFSVYALLGFGSVNMDGVDGSAVDVDETGFQWGIGASYEVAEDVSVFVDYTSLASDMDGHYYNGAHQVDADALTVGVTYNF